MASVASPSAYAVSLCTQRNRLVDSNALNLDRHHRRTEGVLQPTLQFYLFVRLTLYKSLLTDARRLPPFVLVCTQINGYWLFLLS